MKQTLMLLVGLLLAPLAATCGAAESSRPASQPSPPDQAGPAGAAKHPSKRCNVLFIAVDDLNDWVGCLGGNPQAITPNLDRLANQRAMVMNKAYCPPRSAARLARRC